MAHLFLFMVSVMHREFIRTEVPGETQKMDDLEKKIAEYEDFQPEIKKLEIDLLSISLNFLNL